MAVWHWYCPRHGCIDRDVEVRRHGVTAKGRCRLCGATAFWGERPPRRWPAPARPTQLRLFGDRR
jgi:hypothetical protein